MKSTTTVVLVLAGLVGACGSGSGTKNGPASVGGAAGEEETGGTGGKPSTGGSGGSVPRDASAPSSGGSPATGGETGGGAGGSTMADAAADSGSSGGTGGATATGGASGGGSPVGWYEAEAIPPNEKAPKSEVHVNPATACKTLPPMPGEKCNAGGGEVTWITEGRMGWLQYNKVSAPADGMYDVTWWYHCGNNDHFGDRHCGGQTDPPTTPSGCRPHQIVVNGTEMPGTYHWPCFPGPFSEIHAVTTPLPLKAGDNTLKVYPKSRDSADMDAIHIQPLGKGIGPIIKSNNVSGSN
jgi:hypothetical protein